MLCGTRWASFEKLYKFSDGGMVPISASSRSPVVGGGGMVQDPPAAKYILSQKFLRLA